MDPQGCVLRITTHLDDKDNLRTSIGDSVRHIDATQDGEAGIVYRINCSIFHCFVVRVDKDAGTSFAHSSAQALQLLPSVFARKNFYRGYRNDITHEESSVAIYITAKVPLKCG